MNEPIDRMASQPLSRQAMLDVMEQIVTGAMPAEEIGVFLTMLAERGETSTEIAAAVESLRRHAVRLPLSRPLELCDTCGTGGDGQGTFNISTVAAFVAAAAGARIVKHGNRAASSQCGSADVLQALGVNIEPTPQRVAQCVEELGIGFCFAPLFHPAMKIVAPVRKALGIRTIFNIVGPLANPATLTFQCVGVGDLRLMEPVAEALRALGVRRALVLHGVDGMDEATTTAETEILELREGEITRSRLTPESVGLPRATLEQVRGGDISRNAHIARSVLQGRASARLDIVALNAGCILYAANQAPTLREAVAKASDVLASGRAMKLLLQLLEMTNRA